MALDGQVERPGRWISRVRVVVDHDAPVPAHHDTRVWLDVEDLPAPRRGTAEERAVAVPFQPELGNHARVQVLAGHRLHGVSPDPDDRRHARPPVQASSVKRSVLWPMAMVSPSDSCFSITGSPLTSVPLALPRSLIQTEPVRTSIRPWWPDVAGSPTTTPLSAARPMVTIWLGRATILPANGPASTVGTAPNPGPSA